MFRKWLLLSFVLAGVLLCPADSRAATSDRAALAKQAERLCIKKQFAEAEQIYVGLLDGAADAEERFGIARKLAAVLAAQEDKQALAKAAVEGMLTDYAGHARLPHAIHEIAESCHKFGKAGKAKDIYAQILGEQPGRSDAIWLVMNQAIADTFAGDEDGAWANTEELLNDYQSDSRAAEAVGQVAWCCRKIKNWENARALYQSVVDEWPDNERAIYSQRGVILASLELGDMERAQAGTENLLQKFSNHADFVGIVSNVASGYADKQQFEKARDLNQYIVDSHPGSDKAMLAQRDVIMADIALRDADRRNAGIDKLLKDFGDHKDIVHAAYQVGRRLNFQDKAKAREMYEFAVEKDDKGRFGLLAKANLGSHKLLDGDEEGAEALFDELWSKNKNHPNFAEVATIMGEGYWNAVAVARSGGPGSNYQPSTRRSLGVWQRIIDELPETEFHTAEAYFFAGECHRYLEEWASAIEKYEELVERWPDFMYSERAQLTIIRCTEKLIREGKIPRADGVAAVREACYKLINDYPDGRGVYQAQATLKKWEPFEAAQIATMERYKAWSERSKK